MNYQITIINAQGLCEGRNEFRAENDTLALDEMVKAIRENAHATINLYRAFLAEWKLISKVEQD